MARCARCGLGAVLAFVLAVGAGLVPRAQVMSLSTSDCESKLCLVHPKGCLSKDNCTVTLAIYKNSTADDGSFVFELTAKYKGYVAMALAASTSMGNDSSMDCIYYNDEVKAYMAQNHPTTASKRNVVLSNQTGITLVSGTYTDDVISCIISRDRYTTVGGKSYDLESGSWILQLVAGNSVASATSIKFHDVWNHSNDKLKLTKTGVVSDMTSSDSSSGAAAAALSSIGLLPLLLCLLLQQ